MDRVDADTTAVREATASFEHVDLASASTDIHVSQPGSDRDDSIVIDKDSGKESGAFGKGKEEGGREQEGSSLLQDTGVDKLTEDDTGEIQPDEEKAPRDDDTIHRALDQEQGMSRTADAYSNEEQGLGKSPHSSKDPVVREFEEAAAVAAAVTKEAATAAQQKLMKASKEMRGFVSSLWSSFDGPLKQDEDKDVMQEIKEKLGLGEDENILESFRCKLIQQYMPSNNAFTQPKSIGFGGQLHIASAHIGFELDSGSSSPICVPRQEIKGVKQEDMCIVVTLSGGRSLIFGHFSFPRLEVESACTLLNKLCTP